MGRMSLEPSRNKADYPFVHRVRTRFAETDAMGVVHHAAYLPYLEEARVAYLRSIGHPYDAVRTGRDAPVRDRRPLLFDEEVEVALTVGAVTRATFQIAYLLTVAGVERATAVTVHGCV